MSGKHLAPKRVVKKPAKRPRSNGVPRVLRYAYIALTVISALIVLGYVIFHLMSAPPDVDTPDYSRPPTVITTQDPNSGGDTVVTTVPGPSDDKKDQFYTFLLVGQSEAAGGNLTDTMMLASYDVPNQKLSIMSLPRDTYVNYNGRNVLLNTIYTRAGGEKGHDAAITALKREVSKLTGVYPNFSVVIKWEAFGELVDAIDGVYYDVPRDMKYWDPTQNLRINVKKGYQLLDGDLAMQVIRWRHGNTDPETGLTPGYVDGDLGRIRTQQGVMKAIIKKCLQLDVLLSNLGDYISIFQKNVTTDLTVTDLTYFAKSAVGGLDMDNVTFVTLPYKDAGDGAHLLAVPEKVLETVNEHFNPYLEDLTLGELDIVTSIPLPTKKPTPSPKPSSTPKPSPSAKPTSSPKPTNTAKPTPSAEPSATSTPSAEPSVTPTPPDHEETPVSPSAPPSAPVETGGETPTVTPPVESSQAPAPTPPSAGESTQGEDGSVEPGQ